MNVAVRRKALYFDDGHPEMQKDQQILRTGSKEEKDEAWNRIFLRWEERAVRFVLRKVPWLRDEAMDLVQTVFMAVMRHYDPSRLLGSYLAAALDNAVRDVLRGQRRRKVVNLDDAAAFDIPDPRCSGYFRIVPDKIDYEKAKARLSGSDRELIEQHFEQGRSVTAIAAARGLGVPAVSTQIKKALQRLHRELSGIR